MRNLLPTLSLNLRAVQESETIVVLRHPQPRHLSHVLLPCLLVRAEQIPTIFLYPDWTLTTALVSTLRNKQ